MNGQLLQLLDTFTPLATSSGSFTFTAMTTYGAPLDPTQARLQFGSDVPSMLLDFWTTTCSARICYYKGSSGLTLLGPRESGGATSSLMERHGVLPEDDGLLPSDVVVGEFETESNMLIFDPVDQCLLWTSHYSVRDDWDRSASFCEYLTSYRAMMY